MDRVGSATALSFGPSDLPNSPILPFKQHWLSYFGKKRKIEELRPGQPIGTPVNCPTLVRMDSEETGRAYGPLNLESLRRPGTPYEE